MQSRDYLKKQFEQISKAIAKSLANLLKIKFDTIEIKQLAVQNLDDEVAHLLNSNISDFKSKIELLPVEALQNLSLLLIEISSVNDNKPICQDKVDLINSTLSSKHKTLDFSHFLRNS